MLLSRAAFSPREVARAGDIWRAFQDVAVGGSSAAGWPPERYIEERVSFIVRTMVVLHHRETHHGEALRGVTWPSGFRREMFFRRECRLRGERGPVASATQDWVHVSADLKLVRASEDLLSSFPAEDHEPPVEMPGYEPIEGAPTHRSELQVWHTWMDPLGHVNHPRYVDWADEALARAIGPAGVAPVSVRAVAEAAHYRTGAVAGERVHIETRLIGATDQGDAVCRHDMRVGDRTLARVTTVRGLDTADPSLLVAALQAC